MVKQNVKAPGPLVLTFITSVSYLLSHASLFQSHFSLKIKVAYFEKLKYMGSPTVPLDLALHDLDYSSSLTAKSNCAVGVPICQIINTCFS